MYNTDYNRRLRDQVLSLNDEAIQHTKHFYMSIDDEFPHALGTGLQYAVADGVMGVGRGKEEESESESDEELEGGGDYGYGVGQYAKNFQGSYLDTAMSTFDKPYLKPMATEQELTQMKDGGCKDCEEYLEGDGMVRHDEVKAEMNEKGEEPLLTTKKGRGRQKKGKGILSGMPDAIAFSQSQKGQQLGQKLMDMFNILKGRGLKPEDLEEKMDKLPDDVKQLIMKGKGKRKVQAYLKGCGFFDDLWSGIKSVGSTVLDVGKAVAPYAVPLISALGKPRGRPKKTGKKIGLAQSEESKKYFEDKEQKEGGKKRGRPSKGGKNIGLAQSEESKKYFEDKEQKEGGKKRGRPSKGGKNIGLAQSEESKKYFEDKEQKEGGNFFSDLWDGVKSVGEVALKVAPAVLALGKPKKRGRPAKKGGAVLPDASSAFGANLKGGRMLIENNQMKGHYGGAKTEKKSQRGQLIKKIMAEKKMTLGQASKYIKDKKLL